jgi:hypothetical protein
VFDETIPGFRSDAPNPASRDVLTELEKSRESAARLLETLAQKIGAAPGIRGAAGGVQRAAHYVQAHTVREAITGIDRAARRRPAYAIAIAVVVGFCIGRAIRSR